MENYEKLPEYFRLNECLLRLNKFKKIHEREFESESHWGKILTCRKVFYEELSDEHKLEYDEIFKELMEANIEYLKIVSPEIYFNMNKK